MASKPRKEPFGRPTKYKPEYCQMLIDHMSKGFSFESFCAIINVHPDSLHEWVKTHKDFSVAKIQGKEMEGMFWERILIAGATGQIPGYNAASVIFALKNKLPQRWRDKHEIVNTHQIKIPMTTKEVREIVESDPFLLEDETDE